VKLDNKCNGGLDTSGLSEFGRGLGGRPGGTHLSLTLSYSSPLEHFGGNIIILWVTSTGYASAAREVTDTKAV
jgi:hypothetical protein